MSAITVAAFVSILLTSIAWKLYIDRLHKKMHTDAYEEGWSHGYDIGYRKGCERSEAVGRSVKGVKRVKKITGKGD